MNENLSSVELFKSVEVLGTSTADLKPIFFLIELYPVSTTLYVLRLNYNL